MIRHLKKPIKPLWYSCALVIVVVAVLLQLARLLVPYASHFRPSLEAFAGDQLGATVTMGTLSLSWSGLRPDVVVEKLSVQPTGSEPSLTIEHAHLQLDILASLYYWTPVWHQVDAEGVMATVTQDALGGWSIGGLPRVGDGDYNWRYRSPSALFLMADKVSLENAHFAFVFHNQRRLMTAIPSMTVANNGHFHRMNASAAIENETVFDFILEGVGDPSKPDSFFANAYLALNDFPLTRLAELFGQATDLQQTLTTIDAAAGADVKLWFDFASPSRFLMNGHVEYLGNSSADTSNRTYWDIPFSTDIVGDYGITTGLTIGLRNTRIDHQLELSPARIVMHDDKLNIHITSIDLQAWSEWSQKNISLPADIRNVLGTMMPVGHLDNIQFSLDLLAFDQSVLMTNVRGVSVKPWHNVPGFSAVSGYLEGGLHTGVLLLDAPQFSFFPQTIYREPIASQYASGVVNWQIFPEKKRAILTGSSLVIQGDYGQAGGYFTLDFPFKKNVGHSELVLQLGLKDSNTTHRQLLTPTILPPDLTGWLDRAIKAGAVNQAGLLFRGGLHEGAKRQVQFFADIQEGRLAFSEDWPEIKHIDGSLVVDNQRAYATVHHASIYDDDQFAGDVRWNQALQKRLVVNTSGQLSAASGLRYLKESWLRTKVGSVIDQFSAKGTLDVAIKLDMPLHYSELPSYHSVDLHLKNNQLGIQKANLSFDKVNGFLQYSTKDGFVSKDLTATLFGKPLTAAVTTTRTEAVEVITIAGLGSADIASVTTWTQQALSSYMTGEFDFSAEMTIPTGTGGAKPSLLVNSDLRGVAINLPLPFSKSTETSIPFSTRLNFQEDAIDYRFSLGTSFYAHYKTRSESDYAAIVSLSDTQVPTDTALPLQGFKILGQFEYLDAKAWSTAIKKMPHQDKASSLPADLFFTVKQLDIGSYPLTNLLVSGQREQQGWSFIIDSDDLLGGLFIEDDTSRPLLLDIDYLHWPPKAYSADSTDEDNRTAVDWLADIDTATFIPMDVKINRLVYEGKPLGKWSFQLRPDAKGVELRNIYASAGGFSLTGYHPEQGAFLRWQYARDAIPMSTRFAGVITGGSPKNILEQWQLPSVIDSNKTTIETDIFWLGSPLLFSVEALRGGMTAHFEKGVFNQEKAQNAAGVLRLLSLFNFDSWLRRVRLDFSDVYKKGIPFDDLQGELRFTKGIIDLIEPLEMRGPSSKMTLTGMIDYPAQTVDAELMATLPVGGNLTMLAALTGGLPIAAGVFVLSKLFGKQLDKAASVAYRISGDINEPVVTVEKSELTPAAVSNPIISADDNNTPAPIPQ
jgi:uncharacterized protein (TIGR02099 family)